MVTKKMGSDINISTGGLEQLVVFTLANKSYGVSISKVNGIERMQKIAKVPDTPDFVEGTINLRGRVIPVINMKTLFNMPSGETTKNTRIVVVNIEGFPTGIIVDVVTEVLRVPAGSVESVSPLSAPKPDADHLTGIARFEDKMIFLLSLSNILSMKQFSELTEPNTATETTTQRTATVKHESQSRRQ
ncbi:MAG: chemotaxis protein CheW [Chloroflexota bacterium]|nr:chemotaxis protein CheW [Chloroflexota bacterium]